MFALRGIAVSFSVFVVLYATLSVAVGCVWRPVWRELVNIRWAPLSFRRQTKRS